MTDRGKLPYRPCVGVVLLNRRGLAFVGKRRGGPETGPGGFEWQMPQGGIDEGEEPLTAARRELYEETNIRSIELLSELGDWLSYDLPPDMVGKGWTKYYRGQRQKWFAFRFLGEEDEIDIAHPGGGHQAEFEAWRWERLERLPALIVPFKRPVYQRVIAEFRHLAE